MKQLRTLALGAVLLLVLTSCDGLVRNAIDTQKADDMLGFSTLRVKARIMPIGGGLAAQDARTLFTATETIRFKDIDWADIQSKAPIKNVPKPLSYREVLGISEAGIILTSPSDDAPSLLVIEGITLGLRFSNANDKPDNINFTLGMEQLPVLLRPQLERTPTDSEGSRYRVDAEFAEALLSLIDIQLNGPMFARLFNEVLTPEKPQDQDSEADQNKLTVDINVWLSSPDGDGTLAGSEFTFQFATRDGVLDWTK